MIYVVLYSIAARLHIIHIVWIIYGDTLNSCIGPGSLSRVAYMLVARGRNINHRGYKIILIMHHTNQQA